MAVLPRTAREVGSLEDIDADLYSYDNFHEVYTERNKYTGSTAQQINEEDVSYLKRAYERQRLLYNTLVQLKQVRRTVELLTNSTETENNAREFGLTHEQLRMALENKLRVLLGIS